VSDFVNKTIYCEAKHTGSIYSTLVRVQ